MKLREMTHNVVRKIDGKVIAASIVLTQSCPVLASAATTSIVSPGTDQKKILNGTKILFATAGSWAGAIWAIGGVFALILSVRNEDTETRNKAILNIVAAVLLFLTGQIIDKFF